jgi:hypothetical protein
MNMNQNQTLQYLALGILVGYLSPYLIALIKEQSVPTKSKTALTNES